LGYCKFNYEDLKTEYYFEKFTLDGRECFLFKSGKKSRPILNSTIGGRDDGLHFILDPKMMYNFESMWFILHDQLTLPVFEILPYNPCYNDINSFPFNKTIINHIKSLNQTYEQTKCIHLCFDANFLDNNTCNFSNTSIGNVWTDCFRKNSDCIDKSKKDFFKESVID